MTCFSILLYADDIVLLAPSVHSLQLLLHTCEDELSSLDMRLNIKKSVCIRIGPRYKADCCNLVTSDNCELLWCNSIRYLGVYMTSSAVLTCSFSNSKKSTFRAVNALFGRVGRATSPDVIVQLFKAKCLPALYYGSEACPVNKTVTKSLQYVIESCFSKIFQTRSDDVIAECMNMFNCLPVADAISRRKSFFLSRFSQSNNFLCYLCGLAAF